jgi:ferredoxin
MIGLRAMLGRAQAGGALPTAAADGAHEPAPAGVPAGEDPGHPDRPAHPAAAPDARLAIMVARDVLKRHAMVSARVVADSVRCVECGICSFNCPLGIDVRSHVRRGLPVSDRSCLTCGECVARCPRGTLRFEESPVFAAAHPAGDA